MTKIDFVEGETFLMDYCCFGSGKRVLVLLPGISLQPVSPLVEFIAAQYAVMTKDYTVYLFDRKRDISDGYSIENMADDTAEAMHKLGISSAYVYGCSQGGMIAQVMAAKHPELVAKLALCSTMCDINDVQLPIINKWLDYAEAGDALSLVRGFFKNVYSKDFQNKHAKVMKQMEKIAPHINLQQIIYLVKACLSFNATALLPFIKCETIVLASEYDDVLGVEASRKLAERLACKSKIYSDYGHAVYDETPDVLQEIQKFFN